MCMCMCMCDRTESAAASEGVPYIQPKAKEPWLRMRLV